MRAVQRLLAILMLVGLAGGAHAFLVKPVIYIIPFSKGGESDISARFQKEVFERIYDFGVILNYEPGAGGAIAWKSLNERNPDGHTIMGVNLPHIAIQPEQEAGYATSDLTPVYWFHYTPDAIVVRAESPFQTLAELINYANENPGSLSFSGSGKGTANHLAQVTFDKLAGIETAYVPFKGTGAASKALSVGQTEAQWGFTTVGVRERKNVRLLAVAMEERHPAFPEVPTFRELGIDLVGGAYRGIAVPSGVSEEMRMQWSDLISKINADEAFQASMERAGFALVDVGYEEMADFMTERTEVYLDAARAAGVL